MKGLSIKKLAAIAVGGALVGSALAPLAAAIDVTRSDVIGANGSPVVNVVAGNGAAASDFVWAGNIAAKVAQLATVETALTGGEGETTAGDLTVDLAIGGSTSYSTEYAKTYDGSNYDFNNMSTATPEFLKAPSSGQLPFLYNASKSYRYNGSSYNTNMKESVGIKTDVRFITQKSVKDLVGYMQNVGDFNYVLNMGDGIPCRAGSNNAIKFTDGSSDNVIIPFLGEEFTVQECDMISSTRQIKLIKESAKATYNEGDTIPGLVGKGSYAGEEMSVKLASVTQTSGTAVYQARFDLYDAEGNLVDSQTVSTATYLNDTFLDAEGAYALTTVVYVSEINVEPTTSRGVMTMVVGKNVVSLADNKQYPYDSTNTDTSSYYWMSTFDLNTGAAGSPTAVGVNTVERITIKNKVKAWNQTNPLWTQTSSLTEAGIEAAAAGGDTAHFLQGEEDSLGYDFVKVLLSGFKVDQDTTNIAYGNGSIVYRDSEDSLRTIPFYMQVPEIPQNQPTEQTWTLDGVDFFAKCYKPASVTFNIFDDNRLNGAVVDFLGNNGNFEGSFIVTDNGPISINDANLPRNVDLNGVQYQVTADLNVVATYGDNNGATLVADGNCSYSSTTWGTDDSSATYLQVGGSSVVTQQVGTTVFDNKAVYFDDDNTSRTPGKVPIYFSKEGTLTDTYRYRQYYSSNDDYIYLLLDNSTAFSNTFTAADANFVGTDYRELGDYPTAVATSKTFGTSDYYPFYWPDEEAFGNDPTDSTYIVAIFSARTNTTASASNNFRVYIDTSTDNLVQYPQSPAISNYTADINYIDAGQPNWALKARTDTESALYAGWTDFGAKAVLSDDMLVGTITVPESQLYLSLTMMGEGAVQTVAGGETAEGVISGETVNIGGKNITVESINYTEGTCTVEGATYPQIVPVNQLVYTDSPAPAGSHIIVGGYLVNKLAENVVLSDQSTLQEALTAPGEKVAEVLSNGNIIVAGYTALDTKSAAQELIAALDTM